MDYSNDSAPVVISESRHVYLREDGTSFTRDDIYVKLAVTFRDSMLRRLKGVQLSVFLCVALHCDTTMAAYPSLSTIVKETGYSRPHVIDALQRLEESNLIGVTHRSSKDGGSVTNRYHIKGFVTMGKKDTDNAEITDPLVK